MYPSHSPSVSDFERRRFGLIDATSNQRSVTSVLGIGTDLVEVARIGRIWNRFGERFATFILMSEEQREFRRSRRPVQFLAQRFAAKEAIVKAMGTGFSEGIWLLDVGSIDDGPGHLRIIYSDRGDCVRRTLGISEGHLSIALSSNYICAWAVLTGNSSGELKRS